MPDSQHRADDPALPGSDDPTVRQPVPPSDGRRVADPSEFPTPPPHAPGEPVGGYSPGYPPPPSNPAPPTGNSRTVLVVAGVLGLVLMLMLVIGVVIGLAASGGKSATGTASPSVAAPSTTIRTTTSALPEPAPGSYSMNGITNACDLVDPTPLHLWSSEPDKAPYHTETPPGARDSAGDLTCQIGYKSLASDNAHYNQVAIELDVEFTAAGAPPAYDEWKLDDTATTEPGHASGELTGIGAHSYWATWASDEDYYSGMTYVVGVQDSNVSVRIRIPALRQHGEPPVTLDELGAVARSQATQTLDKLNPK